MHQLDITPSQLCLRLPVVVRHRITQDSPLATWRSGPSGVGADASSEIVVVVSVPHVILILLCARAAESSQRRRFAQEPLD